MTLALLDSAIIDVSRCWGKSAHLTGNIITVLYAPFSGSIAEREADVSGDTITLEGSIDTLDTGTTFSLNDAVKLTDDLNMLGWVDRTGSDEPWAVGKSTTQNSAAANISLADSNSPEQFAKVTSSKGIVIYSRNFPGNFDIDACVANVSDSGVTWNSIVEIISNYTGEAEPQSACYMSDDRVCFAVDYLDVGSGKDGLYVAQVSVSGTTPSYVGDTLVLGGNGGNTGASRLVRTTTDEAVLFYNDGANTNLRAVKVTRSGSSLNLGAVAVLFADTTHSILDASLIDSNTCVILYVVGNITYIQTVDVTGVPSLENNELQVVGGANTNGQSVTGISSTRILTTYNTATQHQCALYSYVGAVTPGNNRMWVYKSIDAGLNWSSRGVKT